MVKMLNIIPQKCTGCMQCELACSWVQTGTFQPSRSLIRVNVFDEEASYAPYTCLQCDWSRDGIGFLLLQKHCGCDPPNPLDVSIKPCCESGWKLVFAGSRFTSDAESRYAPTEGEAAAVAWALKSSRLFVLGCPRLVIITDHKPLLGILNNRDLGSIDNPRLRRIKEHTLEYDFQIKYCPGKLHVGADALSRHPVESRNDSICSFDAFDTDCCESQIGCIVDHAINSIVCEVNFIDHTSPALTTDKVKLHCLQDPNYMELHSLVTSGFPDLRINVPDHAKHYWTLAQKSLLSTYDNIVLYKDKIVIPKSLQVLRVLHSAHQGCTGMIARASASVYWPGIRKRYPELSNELPVMLRNITIPGQRTLGCINFTGTPLSGHLR